MSEVNQVGTQSSCEASPKTPLWIEKKRKSKKKKGTKNQSSGGKDNPTPKNGNKYGTAEVLPGRGRPKQATISDLFSGSRSESAKDHSPSALMMDTKPASDRSSSCRVGRNTL